MLSDLRDRLLRPISRRPLTSEHPRTPPELAPTARGLPVVDPARCDGTSTCVVACPTGAISVSGEGAVPDRRWCLDVGRCIFCAACEDACPKSAISLTGRVELAVRERADLVVRSPIGGRS
jgi:hydrogenase-4 component H/formate hydrogenlyase subunit 6